MVAPRNTVIEQQAEEELFDIIVDCNVIIAAGGDAQARRQEFIKNRGEGRVAQK